MAQDEVKATEYDGHGACREEVLERFRRGEGGAFGELVREHHPMVSRLVCRLLGWREAEGEDVVQEVFLAAYLHRSGFRGESGIRTWLTRIAINKCRSWQRKDYVRRKAAGIWRRQRVRPPAGSDAERLDEESSSRVRRAVQSLPGALREVIVLRYLEEHSIESAAEILHISVNAVNLRLIRGRERLRDILGNLLEERP